MKPIMHPLTEQDINGLAGVPPQALLLTGKAGSGKRHLARYLGQRLLRTDAIDKHPFFREIAAGDEGIETVRTIRSFLQLKTTGQGTIRRLLLISDAHALGHDAQNALLKILEETPLDTTIILTTSDRTSLLPTILSRTQMLDVRPLSLGQAHQQFSDYKSMDVERAYYLSDGKVGLMLSLLEENDQHDFVQAVASAKRLLGEPLFERLCHVDELSKQKPQALELLEALERILAVSVTKASEQGDGERTRQLHMKRRLVQSVHDAFLHNANAKLVLTKLMVEL